MTQERKLALADVQDTLGADYVDRYLALFSQSAATVVCASRVLRRFNDAVGGTIADDEELLPNVTLARLKKEVPEFASSRAVVGMLVGQVCGAAARSFIEYAGEKIQGEILAAFDNRSTYTKLLGMPADDIQDELNHLFDEVFMPIVNAVADPASGHPQKFMDAVSDSVEAQLPDLLPPDHFDAGRQFALDVAKEYREMGTITEEGGGQPPTLH